MIKNLFLKTSRDAGITARLLICFVMLISAIHIKADSYKVNAKGVVNVRATESTKADIIGKVHNGDIVEVTSNDGKWAAVELDGQTGYIKSNFLELVEQEDDQVQDAEEGTEDSSLGTIISYVLIILLSIFVWAAVQKPAPDEKGLSVKTILTVYLALCLLVPISYHFLGLSNVVDHYWTGGLFDGYFMAFINSVILAFTSLQLIRGGKEISFMIVKHVARGNEDIKNKANIGEYLLFFPLTIISVIIIVVLSFFNNTWVWPFLFLLIPVIHFIYITVQNFKTFSQNRWVPIAILGLMLSGTVMAIYCLMIFYKVLILGILAILISWSIIKNLPSAIAEADKKWQIEEEKRLQEEAERQAAENAEYNREVTLDDFWGTSKQVKRVGDYEVKDKDGNVYVEQTNGKYVEKK